MGREAVTLKGQLNRLSLASQAHYPYSYYGNSTARDGSCLFIVLQNDTCDIITAAEVTATPRPLDEAALPTARLRLPQQ
jgi:hypothetical protein